jgi:hypothetical protein
MRPSLLHGLADSAPLVHELECASFDVPPAPQDWLADIETDHDDLIRYAQQLRPCYDRIGRIVGQLAGLIILARLGARFETDWTAVARVVEQTAQNEDALHAVWVPVSARRHHAYLLQALQKTATVTRSFDAALRQPQRLRDQLDIWTRELKQVGVMLGRAAVERLGLLPVDFSQACCNCSAM